MKIAVCHPKHASTCRRMISSARWIPFPEDAFTHPTEIRRKLAWLIEAERQATCERPAWAMMPSSITNIITMNRTVLDQVGSPDSDKPIWYEDVWIWQNDGLVPLLSVMDADYLAHFALGDLFDRNELGGENA